jgi:hypothetical protein
VTNNINDVTPPEIKSISLDKTEVSRGQAIKVTVDAYDESGIERMSIWFKTYKPNGQQVSLYTSLILNPQTRMYEGNINIGSITYQGEYNFNFIEAYDILDNKLALFSWTQSELKFNVTNNIKIDSISLLSTPHTWSAFLD